MWWQKDGKGNTRKYEGNIRKKRERYKGGKGRTTWKNRESFESGMFYMGDMV